MAGPARSETVNIVRRSSAPLAAEQIARRTRGTAITDYTTSRPSTEVRWPNGNSLHMSGARLKEFIEAPRGENSAIVVDLTGLDITADGKGFVFIGPSDKDPREDGGFLVSNGGVFSRVPSEDVQMR